ncbi:MAG: 2-oxo acid dehydrogenase subunit E2, partial [Gammaproteobacteria bacterium]
VKELKTKVGDKLSTGNLILLLETAEEKSVASEPEKTISAVSSEKPVATSPMPMQQPPSQEFIHASPGVRRLAREQGIDITQLKGSGPKDRILKEDVIAPSVTTTAAMPTGPSVDFSQFGSIETQPLTRIKKLTGQNLSRNWILAPHVTQFEEADITELEAFRKAQQGKNKLTLLAFLMKAVVSSLKAFPHFNASLDAKGENLILKKYFNIGIAVDTPEGLVVPVIRNVDEKGLLTLAQELIAISEKARAPKGLSGSDMQGSCFTISSLGGIGGTAFTPIINLPDVAILGVSKAAMKPVYQNNQFVPRLLLPLSLSYDHRVIDGAEGARFIVHLAQNLTDIRQLLL